MRTAVEDDAAVWTEKVCEARRLPARFGSRRRHGHGLVAEAALERRTEALSPTLRLQDPRPHVERRLMAHVLLMAAGEVGDPLALGVQMEADNGAFHSVSVRGSALVTADAQEKTEEARELLERAEALDRTDPTVSILVALRLADPDEKLARLGEADPKSDEEEAAVADLLDLRVQPQVRVAALERPCPEGFDLLVEAGADPGHVAARDAQAERLDQLADLR